jgi:hypothetical protein
VIHAVKGSLDLSPRLQTGRGFTVFLFACERGEDTGKHIYEAALKQDLPMEVRTIIERQYQGVKANHDRVRDLRNAALTIRALVQLVKRAAKSLGFYAAWSKGGVG